MWQTVKWDIGHVIFSNLELQANLPELLRSIPPRVKFTSLPFWGTALWHVEKQKMKQLEYWWWNKYGHRNKEKGGTRERINTIVNTTHCSRCNKPIPNKHKHCHTKSCPSTIYFFIKYYVIWKQIIQLGQFHLIPFSIPISWIGSNLTIALNMTTKYVQHIFKINYFLLLLYILPNYLALLIITLKNDIRTHCKKDTYKKPQQRKNSVKETQCNP